MPRARGDRNLKSARSGHDRSRSGLTTELQMREVVVRRLLLLFFFPLSVFGVQVGAGSIRGPVLLIAVNLDQRPVQRFLYITLQSNRGSLIYVHATLSKYREAREVSQWNTGSE